MSKKNPIEQESVKRVEPDLETDAFGEEEQKKIVEMVRQDAEADTGAMAEYLNHRRLDLQHLDGEKPSKLEQLEKEDWQSDRNYGLAPAVVDLYQATLYATAWNPDSINFRATEINDLQNKDNIEKVMKFVVGKTEVDLGPEVDENIQNKVTQGFSMYYIYWKVWYEWADSYIPKKDSKGRKAGNYTIKTENKRFERGAVENVSDVEDILLPRYGKKLQDLPHMIHIIHNFGHEVLDFGKRNIYMNVTEKWLEGAKQSCLGIKKRTLEKTKASQLGIADITDQDLRGLPVDLHVWYGIYKKNRKQEKYRFIVDLATLTFLSGKPLRKIRRDGKYPFVGGPFIQKPGQLRGKSLIRAIMHIVNAFNNVFNQKSDFQYVENCPIGFVKIDENFSQQEYKLKPGTLYPVAESPIKDNVYFPNNTRSMGWAMDDMKILFELLERITGAASYFMTTSRNTSGTATRDMLVNEKSETRFGLWVGRIQAELCEVVNMLRVLYGDKAPKDLGRRIIGEDGKQVFKNLSVRDLRGHYDSKMSPDIASGSKAYERQIMTNVYGNLQQSVWMNPQINPRGSWKLTKDYMAREGLGNPEQYLPPEPPLELGAGKEVQGEWTKFMQGDEVEVVGNPAEHLMGHMKQKDEKYDDLPEEYKNNFDKHLFDTQVAYQDFVQKIQQDMMANKLAMGMINEKNRGVQNNEADKIINQGQ